MTHKYKSVAHWPDGIHRDGNISVSTYKTKDEALGACKALLENGNDLGIPLKAWVEPIKKRGGQEGNKNGLKDDARRGYIHIRISDEMKACWEKHSKLKNETMTDFIKDSVQKRIHRDIYENGLIFSSEGHKKLIKFLEENKGSDDETS